MVQVERGEFASIDDAARQLLDERIAQRIAESDDDLAWVRPYVETARADIARGDVLSRHEHDARMDVLLTAPKG